MEQKQSVTEEGKGKVSEHRNFHFTVDNRQFHVDTQLLTGAQIKAKAGIDPTFGLFREGHDHEPNQQIGDAEAVDLSQPGNDKFFTVPPATFGAWR